MTRFIPAARVHALTPLFDLGCSIVGLGRTYRIKVIAHLALSNAPLTILDAGCGTGSLAMALKAKNPKLNIHAVDADERILHIAKRKTKNIRFQQAYLQRLPYPNNYFDAIYSSLVLHHLPTKEKYKALRELHRVLKKDGTILLSDFGKPRRFAFMSWFTILFEEGLDNYKGKIPGMLIKCGFMQVQKVAEHRGNIHLCKAKK